MFRYKKNSDLRNDWLKTEAHLLLFRILMRSNQPVIEWAELPDAAAVSEYYNTFRLTECEVN